MLCRLAFADALAKVADPVVQQELPIEAMLSQERASQRYTQYYDTNKVGVHELGGGDKGLDGRGQLGLCGCVCTVEIARWPTGCSEWMGGRRTRVLLVSGCAEVQELLH
jgi:hypothetical protein